MSLLKKRVEMNHRSVNRRVPQNSHRPVGRPEGTGFSRTTPELKGERQRPFVEDFNMEHSYSGVAVSVITNSARSDSADSGTSRGGYADPMNSLSCVYLG